MALLYKIGLKKLNVIPNQWGTIREFGIFQPEPVAASSVVFEEIIKDGNVIVDRVRGERGKLLVKTISASYTPSLFHTCLMMRQFIRKT